MAKPNPAILIVGAGPTGLTAAIELARRGFHPRIVDRDEGPTPLSKAVGVAPHSLDLLEPSGVTDRLLADGVHVQRGEVRLNRRKLGALHIEQLRHRFNFLLSLPQSDTETVMAKVLSDLGVEVEWKTELTALRLDGIGVEVLLQTAGSGEMVHYDYVFGADGAHSAVREKADIGFEGYTHRRDWSIADIEVSDWPYDPEAAQLMLHPGGDVGFVIPIGDHRFRAVSNTADALERIGGGFSECKVLRTDTFKIPVRQAVTYQCGGVFLGGDAAHVHSPVGARGMNLGIEDAASFARRLAADDLDGYTAERRPIGKRWIDFSERLLSSVQTADPVAATARNLALRLFGNLPVLQRPALVRVAGLKE